MKIINLQKRIGDFRLNITELELEAGKVHGLIGANGSGKSTLAKLVMGVLEPDRGEILLDDLSIREVSLVPQKPYLMHNTVYENLIYPLKIRKNKPNEEKVDFWLEKCGLKEKRKQYARSLSGGEQQKLALARGLIFEPKLIMIDETFSNLDPDSVNLFMDIIKKKQENQPITWIIISHQLMQIRCICDRVHIFAEGEYVQSQMAGELEGLYGEYTIF